MKKFNRIFKRILKAIKKLLLKTDYELLLSTLYNLIKFNLDIIQNPTKETTAQAKRGHIYFVDLGYNYGSELRNGHYCVVLASQGKVATVIPLTSKNPINSKIIRANLGIISKLSKTIISYALINQITTISKSRLMIPKVKGKKVNVKLNASQLDDIEKELKNYLLKTS
ncbi:type II toxin-antitoxin system PemK/MazF family toxin [Fusobacterium canifelinum]|uniref:Type II toxin-antitoxin system PemK/MazF family toxin n=1 Tax=Fusobacterium canifelinum TaxID=285729 RepID=A0ABX7CGF8_9FUSO|nr:type II toxin-antitoxin system PemK/MazF family toxin [Fusobacterium canifelinum]QQS87647.1 type II toxin-antitoxin system PemK/MazF family toxin [Fusobacterium canifelinum]